MSGEINITFACKACGADPAILELPDDYTDDSIAKCKGCGTEFGPYGKIKAAAMETAKRNLVNQMKGAFKGLKGWKVK